MSFASLLQKIESSADLSASETCAAFDEIFEGKVPDQKISAFLLGLHNKGETVDELMGAVQSMRGKMITIKAPKNAIDIVGTGGDAHGTLNISTAVALVVAGCGVPVAKHGNRAATSKAGSSDVLSALGINLNVPLPVLEQCLAEAHICFLFAPNHHPSIKHVADVRKKLGVRTIFNLLGPLINPVAPQYMLLGTSSLKTMPIYADIMPHLGVKHAWIVCGDDGMDELSICAPTEVLRYQNGNLSQFTIVPEDVGLARARHEDLHGGHAEYNAQKLRAILGGAKGAYRDAVVYNAGIGLMIAGVAGAPLEGIRLAEAAIDNGGAAQKLDDYINAIQS